MRKPSAPNEHFVILLKKSVALFIFYLFFILNIWAQILYKSLNKCWTDASWSYCVFTAFNWWEETTVTLFNLFNIWEELI